MTEQDYMRLAIRKAQEGIAAGQSPFGAVDVPAGAVVAATHYTVWRDTHPTAHAEEALGEQFLREARAGQAASVAGWQESYDCSGRSPKSRG